MKASLKDKTVKIVYQKEKLNVDILNSIFKSFGYAFSENSINEKDDYLKEIILFLSLLILLFLVFKETSLLNFVDITKTSSLLTFFLLGLAGGFSTCAALVGGLMLSLTKNWLEIYKEEMSLWKKTYTLFIF